MRVFDTTHEFDYPWAEVSIANWRKYCPWNKESQHVIAVDTLSRRVDEETGILRTERLITCKQSAPRWITPFLGGAEVSYVYELSYVTPGTPTTSPSTTPTPTTTSPSTTPTPPNTSTQPPNPPTEPSLCPPPPKSVTHQTPSVTMISQNLTWADLLSVRETVTYTPSPADASKTQFRQHAHITALCGGWQKIRDKVEVFTVERFGQNAERGRVGFEEVLRMSRRVWREEREREKGEV